VNPKREQQLIRAAQQGDERAFGELYSAYMHNIYRYILLRVEQVVVAQDLTSEVFLRAIEGLARYQTREVPFLAWLYRIAHARVIDYYRRARRHGSTVSLEDVEIATAPDLDSDLTHDDQQRMLRAAISTLPPEPQLVIILRFIEGYSLEQTARVLGKSLGAVKMIQRRALQVLRVMLQRQDISPDE
jgi:RNA polymerase sigma-70 factor (ECF subfamily)